jgi:S-adenosylmethionine hydrolase
VQIGSHVIPRIVATYAEAKAGELCALVGSSDYLEIAVNGGSAAATVGQGRGAIVQLRASA